MSMGDQVMTIDTAARVTIAVALSLYAAVASPQSLSDAVHACTAEANDAARLACYDRAAGRHTEPAAPDVSPAEAFGAEAALRRKAAEKSVDKVTAGMDKLEAHVARVSQAASGALIVELDNGQRWEQVVVKPNAVIPVGAAVTISRGSLRSFWLTTESNGGMRVRRIQ
jgi:phospholipase A1